MVIFSFAFMSYFSANQKLHNIVYTKQNSLLSTLIYFFSFTKQTEIFEGSWSGLYLTISRTDYSNFGLLFQKIGETNY
jgi:hypothetical protein